MPIRVMSWNINKFNYATIDGSRDDRTDLNEWYILEAVTAQQLDIVIIIEVQSNTGALGTPIGGNGALGVQTLLATLREEQPAADWRLVPPSRLNDSTLATAHTEGIAVYYRNSTLTYTGPYYYNGPGHPASSGSPGVDYADGWAGCLPDGNRFAPQVTFQDYFGRALTFPDAGNRPPMLTTFTEDANGRNVRILAVHLPPGNNKSSLALPSVKAAYALYQNLGATGVAITIGDLNYDQTKPTNSAQNHRYNSFTGGMQFKGFTNAQGVTRTENTDKASLDLVAGGLRRYQLVEGIDGVARPDYLDNAYIYYSGGAPGGAAYHPAVLDLVAGAGGYATTMSHSIATILGQAQYNATDLFREDPNYGHVARYRGVSDHLPIVIDVP